MDCRAPESSMMGSLNLQWDLERNNSAGLGTWESYLEQRETHYAGRWHSFYGKPSEGLDAYQKAEVL